MCEGRRNERVKIASTYSRTIICPPLSWSCVLIASQLLARRLLGSHRAADIKGMMGVFMRCSASLLPYSRSSFKAQTQGGYFIVRSSDRAGADSYPPCRNNYRS